MADDPDDRKRTVYQHADARDSAVVYQIGGDGHIVHGGSAPSGGPRPDPRTPSSSSSSSPNEPMPGERCRPPALSTAAVEELASALVAVGGMAQVDFRNMFVEFVGDTLRQSNPAARLLVTRHPETWLDVLSILRACLCVDGGVAALCEVLLLLAPGQNATRDFDRSVRRWALI